MSTKELQREYNKNYYKFNRESILDRMKERINCPNCNKNVKYGSLARHRRSKLCTRVAKDNELDEYFKHYLMEKQLLYKQAMDEFIKSNCEVITKTEELASVESSLF
jgi:hypothetical protein